MLLKLGRLDHVSNDISANKAIIRTVAASGASLAISDALCARLGDLIWACGRDYLLAGLWDTDKWSQNSPSARVLEYFFPWSIA